MSIWSILLIKFIVSEKIEISIYSYKKCPDKHTLSRLLILWFTNMASLPITLMFSLLHERRNKTNHLNIFSKNAKVETFAKLLEIGVRTNVILPLLKYYFSILCYLKCILQYCCFFLKKNYGGGQKFSIKRKQNSNIPLQNMSDFCLKDFHDAHRFLLMRIPK